MQPALQRVDRLHDSVEAGADVRLSRLKGDINIGVTTLQQLQEHGPFAPIFTPLLRGTPATRPAPTDLYLATK